MKRFTQVTRMLPATRTIPPETDPCPEVHTPYAAYEARIAYSTITSGFITIPGPQTHSHHLSPMLVPLLGVLRIVPFLERKLSRPGLSRPGPK